MIWFSHCFLSPSSKRRMTSKVELPFVCWKSKRQCFYLLLCWDLPNFISSITISPRFLASKIWNTEASLTPLSFTCTSYEKLGLSAARSCSFSPLTSKTLQYRSSSLQPESWTEHHSLGLFLSSILPAKFYHTVCKYSFAQHHSFLSLAAFIYLPLSKFQGS